MNGGNKNQARYSLPEIMNIRSEMESMCDRWALSDEFLIETGRGISREKIGIGGEYSYGVVLFQDELMRDVIDSLIAMVEDEQMRIRIKEV
jgi:hypothetical protein